MLAYLDEPDDHTHSAYSSEDSITGQEICYAIVTASRPDSLRYLGNRNTLEEGKREREGYLHKYTKNNRERERGR